MEPTSPEPVEGRRNLALEGPIAVALIALGVVVGAAADFLLIALVVVVMFALAAGVRIWAVDRDRRPIVPAWALAVSGLAAVGFGLVRGFGLVFGLLALLVVVVAFVIFGSDIA